jgi:hypothetical protein
MRLIGIGLAVALAIGVLAPNAAMAKPKAPAAGAAAVVDPKLRAQGMKEAPAILATTGAVCTIADARYIGGVDDKKKKIKTAYYELACQNGIGLVIGTDSSKPAPEIYNCLFTAKLIDGKPSPLVCILPGNADTTTGMSTFTQKAGIGCVPTKARAVGVNPTTSFFELACQDGSGVVMQTSNPPDPSQKITTINCLNFEPGGNIFCELTDHASQLKVVDSLTVAANKGCNITDRRYVLSATDGSTYFEVACDNKKGYLLQETAAGSLGKAIDCVEVTTLIAGGCQLTDTVEAKTEKAAFYSTVATKAGFKCNVAKYALFNVSGAKEAVEVQCSDRPDGAVIVSTKDGSQVFNCALSLAEGFKCGLTKIEAVFPTLTTQLREYPAKSYNCNVDKVGAILTDKASAKRYVEVSCGAGEGVLVMVFQAGSNALSDVVSCADIGGGCTLPKNGV